MPCSLPISESSDSLSPEVVMPTAPATELDALEQRENGYKRLRCRIKHIFIPVLRYLTYTSQYHRGLLLSYLTPLGAFPLCARPMNWPHPGCCQSRPFSPVGELRQSRACPGLSLAD